MSRQVTQPATRYALLVYDIRSLIGRVESLKCYLGLGL